MNHTPIRAVHHNLLFRRDGTVWAVWRLTGLEYGHASTTKKSEALEVTQALFRSLRGDALMLGLCTGGQSADVVQRMVDGLDLKRLPHWVDICDATLDMLDELMIIERSLWLAVPLPRPAMPQRVWESASSGLTGLGDALGLAPPPASNRDLQVRLGQAQQIARRIPAQLKASAATPPDVCWIFQRAARRGLMNDRVDAELTGITTAETPSRTGVSHAWLDEVILDEGARTDLVDGDDAAAAQRLRTAARRMNPFRRRFLKTITDAGSSYQAFLVLAEPPSGGLAFPGSEWLMHMDDFKFPVDWAIRMRVVDREAAQAKNRRQSRELSQQVKQYTRVDEDGGTDVNDVPDELMLKQIEGDEYKTRLAGNPSEVEVQACAIACVWGTSPDQAQERADVLTAGYATNEFSWARPVGGQEELYWDMLPGPPTSRTARNYLQITLSRDYATAMPFVGTELGDPTGGLFAVRGTGGGIQAVLADPQLGPRRDASGSVGIVGELGSGKSVALKTLKTIVIGRGGRALTIDRTRREEWVTFAAACPWSSQVVRIAGDAGYSLDPLRMFDVHVAGRIAQSFLTVLFGVPTSDDVALVLSKHLKPAAIAEWAEPPSMAGLLRRLRAEAPGDPVAARAATLIDSYADTDLGHVIFDDTIPPLELSDAEDIIFATSAIALPTPGEVQARHLFDRLPLEKLLGRALLYLIAAIAKQVAFDPDQFAGVFMDEAHHLIRASGEGEQLAHELVRDGRKHLAAAFFGSHDPLDFGPPELRGLLSTRIVMRHRSHDLAARAAQFLDIDPDPDTIDLICRGLSPLDVTEDERRDRAGEALMRDLNGRVGRVKIVIPPHESIAAGILTTPGQQSTRSPR